MWNFDVSCGAPCRIETVYSRKNKKFKLSDVNLLGFVIFYHRFTCTFVTEDDYNTTIGCRNKFATTSHYVEHCTTAVVMNCLRSDFAKCRKQSKCTSKHHAGQSRYLAKVKPEYLVLCFKHGGFMRIFAFLCLRVLDMYEGRSESSRKNIQCKSKKSNV